MHTPQKYLWHGVNILQCLSFNHMHHKNCRHQDKTDIKGMSEALACVFAKQGINIARMSVSTLGYYLPQPKNCPPKESPEGVIY